MYEPINNSNHQFFWSKQYQLKTVGTKDYLQYLDAVFLGPSFEVEKGSNSASTKSISFENLNVFSPYEKVTNESTPTNNTNTPFNFNCKHQFATTNDDIDIDQDYRIDNEEGFDLHILDYIRKDVEFCRKPIDFGPTKCNVLYDVLLPEIKYTTQIPPKHKVHLKELEIAHHPKPLKRRPNFFPESLPDIPQMQHSNRQYTNHIVKVSIDDEPDLIDLSSPFEEQPPQFLRDQHSTSESFI